VLDTAAEPSATPAGRFGPQQPYRLEARALALLTRAAASPR
jgi:hypothetical protein